MIPEVLIGGWPSTAADCQTDGPGKYASSGTAGLKAICGIRPSAHCAPNRLSSSLAARAGEMCCRPSAIKAESQLH